MAIERVIWLTVQEVVVEVAILMTSQDDKDTKENRNVRMVFLSDAITEIRKTDRKDKIGINGKAH